MQGTRKKYLRPLLFLFILVIPPFLVYWSKVGMDWLATIVAWEFGFAAIINAQIIGYFFMPLFEFLNQRKSYKNSKWRFANILLSFH